MDKELEKFRSRWRRWLGNKTRADKPYWVTLLDSNWLGWVDKVFTDNGVETPQLTYLSPREEVKSVYSKALDLATARHLARLDERYVIAKFNL